MKNTNNCNKRSDSWVGYRENLKILDCTIRDGGLINNHGFDDKLVKAVYNSNIKAGVDYMEFGYKASKKIFSVDEHGKWKFSDEDQLRNIIGEKSGEIKITLMADAERTDYKTDIPNREESFVDCYRIACYIHQLPLALDMVQDATDKGYETMLQLMAITTVSEHDMRDGLKIAAKSPAQAIYLVDSYGAMYPEKVRELTKIYLEYVKGTGKEIGFHAHNNQQLAFANTIEALITGANRVDATMAGIGRGAGNCPLELLIGFLHNPKFRLRPILECVEEHFVPLRESLDWGYSIPYQITGQLNEHPRTAIKLRASDNPNAYVEFYDQMIEEIS